MIVARTASAAETKAFAAALSELTRPGDLVLLAGDLGAGKTAFTQGLGSALGVTEPITSPTFTLVNRYEGRLVLYHLDVYRLEQVNEVLDLDLPEMLDDQSVTVIEWGDAIASAVPADYLEIRFLFEDSDDTADDLSNAPSDDTADETANETADNDVRMLHLRMVGQRWTARSRVLATALEQWTVDPSGATSEGGLNC